MQKEQVQPFAVYDRRANEIHTEVLRMHRMADTRLQTRLSAFDTRAAQRLKSDQDDEEFDESALKVKPKESEGDHAGFEDPHSPNFVTHFNSDGVEVIDQEVQVDFKVVRWSSQKAIHPATALTRAKGFWEAAPMKVKNQYVVLELAEPCRITGIEFGLPGNDSGPRQCRLFYSKRSPDQGPWLEAWRFDVSSKSSSTFKSTHDYSSGSMSEQFVHLCANLYGSIDEAWDQILDVNGDGKLSYLEFVTACNRVRRFADGRDCSFLNELQDLFADLDMDDSGQVTIEDLRARVLTTHTPEAVRARYWKLMIRSNFGSIKRLQLAGPLTLYTTVKVPATVIGRMRMEGMTLYRAQTDPFLEEHKVNAFSLEALHVSEEAVMLRRLCEKHDLHSLDIEELYRSFKTSSASGNILKEAEFGEAVRKVYGAGDGDIPVGRVRSFWVSADQSRDGAVDFEEFLVWARTHAEDIKLKSMRSRRLQLQWRPRSP